MCGRGRCTLRCDDIPRACHRASPPSRTINLDRYRPSYNASPGRDLPVVRREDGSASDDNGGYLIHCMKWGLVPSFTNKNEKPDHFKMFNARSESITEKASFRRLIPKSRCLVAFEGFYEWKKDGSKKQPYYIHFKDGRPLVFAALYDSWKNAEGELLYSFTILTTASSSSLEWLHDRMPVILGDKESIDTWLIGSASSKLDSVLRPYKEKDLVWYPVTAAMGKPSFDGPECIKEIKLKTKDKNMISKFFIKNEQVVKPEEQGPDQFGQGNLQKGLKEESKSEDSDKHQCAIGQGEEVKFNIAGLPHDAAEKFSVKREYEELSVDPDHLKGDIDIDHSSSVKKKREVSSSIGDKQPTLLSYFQKR